MSLWIFWQLMILLNLSPIVTYLVQIWSVTSDASYPHNLSTPCCVGLCAYITQMTRMKWSHFSCLIMNVWIISRKLTLFEIGSLKKWFYCNFPLLLACWPYFHATLSLSSCLTELRFAGYALSSVEGRVAMEFFDLSEAVQSKKYVWAPWHLYCIYMSLNISIAASELIWSAQFDLKTRKIPSWFNCLSPACISPKHYLLENET